MSREVPEVQLGLPRLSRWHRFLLGGLFAGYVAELVLYDLGTPLYRWLPWYGFGSGFEPWQPLTRFLVQGADRPAVVNVLVSLMVLFFLLPALERSLAPAKVAQGVLAGAVVGTVLPMALDATDLLLKTPLLGWSPLVFAVPALYGLAAPDDDVLLFIFPAKARMFLWGSLLVAVLYILVERSLDTFQGLGVWLGVFGWWYAVGPGGRRRRLDHQARDIESELRRFQVIEGGKDGPAGERRGRPSPGRNRPDDEWVH